MEHSANLHLTFLVGILVGSSLLCLFSQFVVYSNLRSNLYYYLRLQPRAGLIPLFPVLTGKCSVFCVAEITWPHPSRERRRGRGEQGRGEEKTGKGRGREGRGREERRGEKRRAEVGTKSGGEWKRGEQRRGRRKEGRGGEERGKIAEQSR